MKITDVNDKHKFNHSCIYLLTNLINGKVYVGQTQNCYQRMKQYAGNKEKRRLIGKAIIKYGIDNFDLTLLEIGVPIDKLNSLEQHWMDYYDSYNLEHGYNMCPEAGTNRGYKYTEEDRAKMSKSAKQKFIDHPEYIKRGKDNPMYGVKMSEETRAKMSRSRIGNQNAKGSTWVMSQETKDKISKSMKGKQNCLGRKLSQETKNKIAEANRRRVITDEMREKQRLSHLGLSVKKVRCVETQIVYNSIGDASLAVNRDRSGIGKCCAGRQKTCGGYHWEFVE